MPVRSVMPRRSRRLLGSVVTAASLALVPATAQAVPTSTTSTTSVTRTSATNRTTLRIVALGDSVPGGSACDCVPFPSLAGRRLGDRQNRRVFTTNYARADDSYDVLDRLRRSSVRRTVATSELAIVQVGANDFDPSVVGACRNRIDACYGRDLRAMKRNVTSSLHTIERLQRNAKAEIVVVGYWNVFRDGRVGRARGSNYVIGSRRLTNRVNALLRQAASETGAMYVDGDAALRGPRHDLDPTRYLAADGDHPNARGHRALADATYRRLGRLAALL